MAAFASLRTVLAEYTLQKCNQGALEVRISPKRKVEESKMEGLEGLAMLVVVFVVVAFWSHKVMRD
jgi:hypothetical protein